MKSWGTQQHFPTDALDETAYLKAENQKLRERIVVLEQAAQAVVKEFKIMCETNNMAYHELPIAIGKLMKAMGAK